MKPLKNIFLVSTTLFAIASPPARAVDAFSLEAGSGEHVTLLRIGAQSNWEKRWWQSNGTHIGGHWDLTIAYWRATRFQNADRTQNITDIGITPVFRFQNDSRLGWYGELGIGAHYLSELYNNDGDRFSTRFQFGDHVAIGYVFSNQLEIGLKFQHFSNGGIKKPNGGADFYVVKVSYAF